MTKMPAATNGMASAAVALPDPGGDGVVVSGGAELSVVPEASTAISGVAPKVGSAVRAAIGPGLGVGSGVACGVVAAVNRGVGVGAGVGLGVGCGVVTAASTVIVPLIWESAWTSQKVFGLAISAAKEA